MSFEKWSEETLSIWEGIGAKEAVGNFQGSAERRAALHIRDCYTELDLRQGEIDRVAKLATEEANNYSLAKKFWHDREVEWEEKITNLTTALQAAKTEAAEAQAAHMPMRNALRQLVDFNKDAGKSLEWAWDNGMSMAELHARIYEEAEAALKASSTALSTMLHDERVKGAELALEKHGAAWSFITKTERETEAARIIAAHSAATKPGREGER